MSIFADFVTYWNVLGPHLGSLVRNALQCFSEALAQVHTYVFTVFGSQGEIHRGSTGLLEGPDLRISA